jgi:alpha-tubulin suppressor-like RCC1 family protein
MRRYLSGCFILIFLVACSGATDDGSQVSAQARKTMAGAAGAQAHDSERNSVSGADAGADTEPDPCRRDNAEGASACEPLDACKHDNGGCGDARWNRCQAQVGKPAVCSDIDECALNNGGCGDSRAVLCVNERNAPPTCQPRSGCEQDNGGCGDPKQHACIAGLAPGARCRLRAHIALGRAHACAISQQGQLSCWGTNEYGQLGTGEQRAEQSLPPTRVGSSSDWSEIAAGGDQTCGIRAGELYCWGDNVFGQLGYDTGSADHKGTPGRVGSEHDWELVSVGVSHACGIRKGELYCWGDNGMAQLGNGPATTSQVSPKRVGTKAGQQALSSGDGVTCGIQSGELYCWGDNARGQLNGMTQDLYLAPVRIGNQSDWTQIATSGLKVNAGAAGLTCGLRRGELHCWGDNEYGQLGRGGRAASNEPARVGDEADWTQVSVSQTAACGVRRGELYCWGDNYEGQLGIGDAAMSGMPTRVGTQSDWEQVVVSAQPSAAERGTAHALCGLRAGSVSCWGDNQEGQLGSAVAGALKTPTQVVLP